MNLGLQEILIIFIAAMIFFGPKRLPELAKSLGKSIRDFKKAMNEEESPSETSKLPGPTSEELNVTGEPPQTPPEK